jgi:hypothetical protein
MKKLRLILAVIAGLSSFSSNAQCVAAPVPNDACYNTVITNDPFCCNTMWDAICQNAYDACIGAPPPPPPCVAAPVPNDACYNTVITNDPFCCNTMWDAICQAAYDACAGPPPPPPGPCANITNIIGCGTSQGTTLSGPGTWNNLGCGFNTPGNESIWSFTATQSGIHSLDITSITGGFVDFMWINSTAGCSENAGWNCIDDVFTPGVYGSMNWTAGQTYYILIDPEGTGTYDMSWNVECPNPPAVPSGDCSGAIPICSDANFQVDPSGFGNIDELCTGCYSNPSTNPSSANSGCLLSGELNSTWMTVSINQGGTLEFSFGSPGGGLCFDWMMWPYDPATTCTDIYNDAQAPVACNWNGFCDGFTGVTSSLPAGGDPSNFEPTMNVNTGDEYVILFSNYSSALTSVPLNFFGSADISCTPLPVEMVGFNGSAEEGYNELVWTTASEINCSHFDIERSNNGIEFEKIGEVKGSGTSLQENNYRFNHYGFGTQTNYYRLKQTDYNGAYKYSNVIAIDNKADEPFMVVSAYPNPATDQFSVQVYIPENEVLNIEIAETNGKTVRTFSDQQLLEGNNTIDMPIQGLSNGVYLVTLKDQKGEKVETLRMVIQK